MKRKFFLAAALFIALGMIGLLSHPATAFGQEGAVMTGVWSWQNTMPSAWFGPDAVLPSVLTFHNDGTTVCSDGIAFGGLPLAYNGFCYTPFQGVWERTGPHEFTATWLSLRFDRTTGVLDGFARARAKFKFSTDFDHIAGTLYMDFLRSSAGPLKVPDPLAPDAIWVPSALGELQIKAARVSVVPY